MEDDIVYGQEVDAIVGLAKANEGLKQVLMDAIFDSFWDDILDRAKGHLLDGGWRSVQ